MQNKRALEGVVVLDCSQILAGPFCTMLLGDMGADVIKIEKPGGGDDTRRFGPPFVAGESVAFLQLNRNKRSITLNLRSDKGKEAFRRLAARAEILVENYRPGTMTRLGLDYSELSVANPALVYCSISGFGLTGPYARRAGFDLVAQGMSGLMSINGHPDAPPAKIPVPMADLNAGLFAAYGIVAAYVNRLRTGKGQYLETSLLEAALAYTVYESSVHFATGEIPRPTGSQHRLIAPYQAFRTSDGYINIGAANQGNWERMCRAIGREDLLDDPRFADNAARLTAVAYLQPELDCTFAGRSTEGWLRVLEEAGVPAGPIYDMEQAWSDEQVQAREMDVTLDHPTAGPVRNIGLAVKMYGTPGEIRSPAPLLGQHTDEVLELAGYAPDEIVAMRDEGVAGPNG